MTPFAPLALTVKVQPTHLWRKLFGANTLLPHEEPPIREEEIIRHSKSASHVQSQSDEDESGEILEPQWLRTPCNEKNRNIRILLILLCDSIDSELTHIYL